jgi:hypothetical protein
MDLKRALDRALGKPLPGAFAGLAFIAHDQPDRASSVADTKVRDAARRGLDVARDERNLEKRAVGSQRCALDDKADVEMVDRFPVPGRAGLE